MSKYQIEFSAPDNGSHIFTPLKESLRGRWDFANVADKDLGSPSLKQMAREVRVVPGLCVAVNDKTMEGVIFDPLSETAEGKALWEKIERIMSENKAEWGGGQKPHPVRKFKLSPDDVKNWLWEFRQCLNAGQAVQCSGSDQVPSAEEISQRPGRRLRDPMNSGQQTGTGKPGDDHLVKYVDDVPVDGKKEKESVAT